MIKAYDGLWTYPDRFCSRSNHYYATLYLTTALFCTLLWWLNRTIAFTFNNLYYFSYSILGSPYVLWFSNRNYNPSSEASISKPVKYGACAERIWRKPVINRAGDSESSAHFYPFFLKTTATNLLLTTTGIHLRKPTFTICHGAVSCVIFENETCKL